MKKASKSPQKKSKASNGDENTQKKILSFFSSPKSVLCTRQEQNVPHTEITKNAHDKRKDAKRKIEEDSDIDESPFKLQKSNPVANFVTSPSKKKYKETCRNDIGTLPRTGAMSEHSIKDVTNMYEKITGIHTVKDKAENDNINKLVDGTKNTLSTEYDPSIDLACEGLFDDPFDTDIPDTTESYDKFFEDDWNIPSEGLILDSFQRCIVTNVKEDKKVMTLSIQHVTSDLATDVVCYGRWKELEIKKNDIISLKAAKKEEQWTIDNDDGFIIIYPEILVSGTTIVGAVFCNRKAVLSEKFRKLEYLPQNGASSSVMFIGSLVHEVLQKALKRNISSVSDVVKLMDEMLELQSTILSAYSAEITLKECRKQMMEYIPNIFEFIQHYLKGNYQESIIKTRDNFQGRIQHVHDIEENIWLPQLGIKGKIDVTVEVKTNNSSGKIMPLEVKTGKTSFSIEHKGQVVLYTMMMSLLGYDTDVGLLLYLKDNSFREIRSKHNERRELILLRNNLVQYLVRNSMQYSDKSQSEENLEFLELPEPIRHHSACSRCPYNTLCCVYAAKDTSLELSESHPLNAIIKQLSEYLKPSHIDYVTKWISLLQLEESAQREGDTRMDTLTLAPEKREEKGICLSNLKVEGKVVELYEKYQHTFMRAQDNKDLTFANKDFSRQFADNEYVLISTNTRVNVSAGYIVSSNVNSVTVLLDRDLTQRNRNAVFHIDKYGDSASLFSYSFANVGGLLGDSEMSLKLREIVIDKKPATFAEKVPQRFISAGTKILRNLNAHQKQAVFKVLAANEYMLIKGMPGTGKTQTIVALIELLNELGCSVLVTAHTHSAVDNIFLKLLDRNVDFLRLGSTGSTHPLLKCKSEEYLFANCDSTKSLESVYNSKNVVGVTCFGAHHVLLGKRIFDICIVDECTQVLQSVVLRPLYSARKFVLVGDPKQLPPIAKSDLARKLGASESLFLRLDSENNTVALVSQYRMNKTIMNLANNLTYEEQLKAGNVSVEQGTFSMPNEIVYSTSKKWIRSILSAKLEDSVVVVDTGTTYSLKSDHEIVKKNMMSERASCNIWEAAVAVQLIQILLQMGVTPGNIGIMAPFRAQISLLRKLIPKDIEVNTVDQYQGRDKDIILYTCVKSFPEERNKKRDFELLEDHQRLTVAVTRAKYKLIIIADKGSILQYTPFRKLFASIEEENILHLTATCDDFIWDEVLNALNGTDDS